MKTELQLQNERLARRLEEVTHERDLLAEAIGEATEQLGHSGFTPTDLADAVRGVTRLAEGSDVDCGIEYEGLAAQVEAMVWLLTRKGSVWLLTRKGSDGEKTKAFMARLPFLQGHGRGC